MYNYCYKNFEKKMKEKLNVFNFSNFINICYFSEKFIFAPVSAVCKRKTLISEWKHLELHGILVWQLVVIPVELISKPYQICLTSLLSIKAVRSFWSHIYIQWFSITHSYNSNNPCWRNISYWLMIYGLKCALRSRKFYEDLNLSTQQWRRK